MTIKTGISPLEAGTLHGYRISLHDALYDDILCVLALTSPNCLQNFDSCRPSSSRDALLYYGRRGTQVL
jgi:hypothetical protein